jgi:pyruvate/2-oxoglutarate dehydrogenase complex dihydrolipoamide acyltransferase (E2) component
VDEILIEIETDKVVLEVPAPAAGVLAEIVVGDGATVVAEQLIAKIDTEGKAGAPLLPPLHLRPLQPQLRPAAAAPPPAAAPRAMWPCPPPPSCWPTTTWLGSVAGTGKDGRVTKGDVLGAVWRPGQARRGCPAPFPPACPPRHCRKWLLRRCPTWATPRAARAHEPPARPRGRAPAAVAIDQRHPDHVQRSEHGPGDGDAQEVPGRVRPRNTASRSAS